MTADQTASAPDPPPLLFQEPVDAPEGLPPIRQQAELQEMHQRWAALSAPASTEGGWLQRSRKSKYADRENENSHELIGVLIRAIDKLAQRSDELANRLHAVEAHLDDMATVLGEDLVQIRARLGPGQPVDQSGQ